MSKLPHNSASSSKDLIERLKAVGDDALRLRAIVEGSDIGSVAAAFAALFAGDTSSALNDSKPRKACNRLCRSLPSETFAEVVLFADRDTLDAMQLVCSFLLNFIRERDLTQLALRAILEVNIGRRLCPIGDNYDAWLPVIEVVRKHGGGKEPLPKTVHQLTFCLRMSFCEEVCIDFDGAPEGDAFGDACGMVFDDLVAPNTFVDTLDIHMPSSCSAELPARVFAAFKSLKNLSTTTLYNDPGTAFVGDDFFTSASQNRVRCIVFNSTFAGGVRANVDAALSHGFSEPTAGGDRCLLGFAFEIGTDFLEQVKQKVVELEDARDVDFNFKLASVSQHIDSAGFEKYQRDDGQTWLMSDLENRVNVEVKQTMGLIEIHVFSSV